MNDTLTFESVPHTDFVLIFEDGVGLLFTVVMLLGAVAIGLHLRRRRSRRRS